MKRTIVIILSILLFSVDTATAYPPVPLSAGASAQDAMIEWEPLSVDLYESLGLVMRLVEATSFVFNLESLDSLSIISGDNVTTISFPNLVSVDPYGVESGVLGISDLPSLTSFSAPSLSVVGGSSLSFTYCPLLENIDLSSLTLVSGGGLVISGTVITALNLSEFMGVSTTITITGNTLLTSIVIPKFVPYGGQSFDFSGNALSATTINVILARCVASSDFDSGSINLSGGTNAAPTGQGLADVTTLRARGVTVTVNGE